MFGTSFWSSYAGSNDHLTKEREPPPHPIELEFPEYIPPFNPHPLTDALSRKIQDKICHTRSFSSIEEADLEQLNINFEPNVPLSSLVPIEAFPKRPYLYDDDLQSMIDEISVENQDGFREVLRMPPLEGRTKPRLAYARNLFACLEDISRYCDNTHDNYYRVPVNLATSEAAETKEAATEGDREVENGTKEVYRGYRLSNAEAMNPGSRIAMTKNLLKMVMHKFQCRDHEPIPQPREKLTIRGIKLQSIQYQFCVARIPQEVKQARARLVEGPIMAVHVRDDLRFKAKDRLWTPEKTSFVGERFDILREVGCMIILAVQRNRGYQDSEQKSEAAKPWWVANARWGGGATKWGQLSHEVFEDEDPSLSPAEQVLREEKRKKDEEKAKAAEASLNDPDTIMVDDLLAKDTSDTPRPAVDEGNPRRKKLRRPSQPPVEMRDGRKVLYVPPAKRRWYNDWQELRENTPGWDRRIIGRRIGNDDEKESGFDEVYLLTSCNHHVAVSKMRIHKNYLEWLQNGTSIAESDAKLDNPAVLYVKRSSWYDMLKAEARKEFLTELWRLMCWINRNEVPKAEYEKMQEKQTQ